MRRLVWNRRATILSVAVVFGVVLGGCLVTFFRLPASQACTSYYTNDSLDKYFAHSGCHGTSWADAYVFDGVTYDDSRVQFALSFEQTTRYVIIRNCVFFNISCGDYASGAGISFVNSQHLQVQNCTFLQCENGMFVQDSQDITVVNCSFLSSEGTGLQFGGTKQVSVTQNAFRGNAIGFAAAGETASVVVSLNNFTANALAASDSTGGHVSYANAGLGNFWDGYWPANPSASVNLSRPVFVNGLSPSSGASYVASVPFAIPAGTSDPCPLVYFPNVAPVVTVTAPVLNLVCNAIPPSYSVAISGTLVASAWLTIDGAYSNTSIAGSGNFSYSGTKTFSGVLNATAWAGLGTGQHVVAVSARNWFGAVTQASVTVLVDLVAPVVTVVKPVAAVVCGLPPPAFNLSISTWDSVSYSVWYSVNGSSSVNASGASGTIDALRWGVLGDGPVNITFWASDAAGNVGSANISVIRSTASPQLSVSEPNDGDLFSGTAPVVNVSVADLAPAQAWCQVGSDPSRYFLGPAPQVVAALPGAAWTAQPDGFVFVNIIAIDSLGNQNSTIVVVQKDTTGPAVQVAIAPPALFAEIPAQFSYSASDPHLFPAIYYTIDASATRYPLSASNCTASVDATAWAGLCEGSHSITVHAWDNASNVGSATFSFVIILAPPVVAVLTKSNCTCGAAAPSVKVSIADNYLSAAWYLIDGMPAQFPVNITGAFPGTALVPIDASAWFMLPDGMHNVSFWAVDALGHQACSTGWWVKKDATGPAFQSIVLSGQKIAAGIIVGPAAPSFAIAASDPSLVKVVGYSLDGGKTITWLPEGEMAGNISQDAWAAAYNPGATITITFYANDSLNNMSQVSVTVLCAGEAPFWVSQWFAAILLVGAVMLLAGASVAINRARKNARAGPVSLRPGVTARHPKRKVKAKAVELKAKKEA